MENTCAFLQRKGEPAGAFGTGLDTFENIIGLCKTCDKCRTRCALEWRKCDMCFTSQEVVIIVNDWSDKEEKIRNHKS